MHYKDPSTGNWKDFPLTFSGHYANYDVFSGANAPMAQEFVIKYGVQANSWDNNGSTTIR